MSSARCLNWSRPPPGRHPVLRKQLSCIESSLPVNSCPSPSPAPSVTSPSGPSGEPDLCHFLVTGAIIHANRLQTYRTYNQAHRGTSASVLRSRPALLNEDPAQRRRPSSASAGGLSLAAADDGTPVRAGRRAILCKQLSLDRTILVASSIASGMATVASGAGGLPLAVGGERDDPGDGWAFNRKQPRPGAASRNDPEGVAKKSLKPGKDSRINIKIFLGQTVQHDSSDTGISDTEGTAPTATARTTSSCSKPEPTALNMSTDTSSGAGKQKPTGGTVSNGPTNVTAGSSTPAAPPNGPSAGGRTSSLAQRRAQFQANRQNSEAHDRRHPPLVRAMSAPIRPADSDASKFLQGKKKPRRRKVLREKDEYNICEEDEFSDDGGNKMAAGGPGMGPPSTATNGRHVPACILPMRSRSVLGGPCDIETLVSLLSSGGSDSEKEQDSTQATSGGGAQSPTGTAAVAAGFRAQPFSSSQLAKGRAPMLKKTGKSVSFQESDLKPVAPGGLNRDYRKPSFQPTVASRIRRTQQLVSTLNAFQLKEKDRGEEKDTNEEKHSPGVNVERDQRGDSPSPVGTPTISSSNVTGKPEGHKSSAVVPGSTANGDLQTPKEQECYRLYLKMSKKGLAVSYDTILRGMLTPTELRVLQKKKSLQRSDTEIGSEPGTAEDRSPENSASDSGMTFEQLQFGHTAQPTENGEMHVTIPEEPPTIPESNDEERAGGEENAF